MKHMALEVALPVSAVYDKMIYIKSFKVWFKQGGCYVRR